MIGNDVAVAAKDRTLLHPYGDADKIEAGHSKFRRVILSHRVSVDERVCERTGDSQKGRNSDAI